MTYLHPIFFIFTSLTFQGIDLHQLAHGPLTALTSFGRRPSTKSLLNRWA
jgi:hypothetical protein